MNLVDSPSSAPTLKRWCQDWAITHPAEWGQAREGGKYVAEKVINPETGKPQRMMLILVLDWASRYPVGAALATSENSQHICVAFRNAFLNWGGLPRFVYLDNGRAFRARLFHGDWQKHDLEDELGGIFPRLGVGVSFAKEYNAQSKVIERFFKTFQEQFERFVTSFRGSCVADQPATLQRNETWMRKLFAGQPPSVPEALQMMEQYFRLYYGQQPHAGLGGRKPYEVFSSAPVPTERVVEPDTLNFLMLNVMSRKVNAEGIILHKLRYYDEKLVDYVGRRVNIRFDYGESRWIMVFDEHDNYVCHAELRRTQHPFIHLDKDNPQSITGLRQELKQITRLRQRTRLSTKNYIKKAQEAVDLITAKVPLVQTETFSTVPLLPSAPPKPLDIERQGLEAFRLLKSSRVETPEPQTSQPRSFDEMLKAIGIK